jgi:RNA polymerase sigma factor (sigma-70 family)
MKVGQVSKVIPCLRRTVLLQDGAGLTDGQLLGCFLAERDEAAFEALVRRHGPIVLNVCRRILRNTHDAEDAFQATFLVLVRKAASINPREKVGNWLHGVAYRTAHEAKTAAARRRLKERRVSVTRKLKEDIDKDWLALFDQELQRLTEEAAASLERLRRD